MNKGTTIILTTHDLSDIEELCNRIIIINKGIIIEDGSLKELIDRIAPYRYLIVDFYEEQNITHPQAEIISVKGSRATYRFGKKDITAARLIEDLSRSATIKDVSLEEADIDDIISIAYKKC
jgi:ABC-2 type transport system ATP-binding protein